MDIAVFSAKAYDREYLSAANEQHGHHLVFHETRLTPGTAILARGVPVVCPFVNDDCGSEVVARLAAGGTRLLALRSAGFNHVDLAAAAGHGLAVVRVPAYSPHAVAEHTVGLMLALSRHIHRAFVRVREGNFSLEGLLGRELHGRTVGVVGTGRIGAVVARILAGFGCRLLAHDPIVNAECVAVGTSYVAMSRLLGEADIISLHCPLTPGSKHLIDARALGHMRRGAMLINTSRGGLVDATAVIAALKSGQLGALGLDVYEEEGDLFFEDLSSQVLQDDIFARLLTFPNVLITGHQAFFTEAALAQIAETTLASITAFERGGRLVNAVTASQVAGAAV